MSPVDSKRFRSALGHFATGVTVITTLDERGDPVGITANSFNSVSLDPPMVLWSIAKQSNRRSAFENSEHFAVNLLAKDQVAVSRSFARGGKAQFADIRWRSGVGSSPLLPGCAARFQCRKVYQYDGGDHVIIVGAVEEFDDTNREALVFHRGQYAVVDSHPGDGDVQPGGYEEDFLMALLMRATHEFLAPFKKHLADLELSQPEVRVLTFLNEHDGREVPRLVHGTMLEPEETTIAVDSLLALGLVTQEERPPHRVMISEQGRREVLPVLAIAKAHEDKVLAGYTPEQVFRLKRALRRLADRSRSRED